jgi:hypothetical protein
MEASGPIPSIATSHTAVSNRARSQVRHASGLLDNLGSRGFATVPAESLDERELNDRHNIYRAFDLEQDLDPKPGRRWRSHAKLMIDRNDIVTPLGHTPYLQTKEYNADDGGEQRVFRPIGENVLSSRTLNYLVRFTARVARQAVPHVFEPGGAAHVGLHMISYRPDAEGPAFSSPSWMHKDDEPFVAVILCGLSANLGGGENLIFPNEGKGRVISHEFKLRHLLEMLLLTKTQSWHAVTPMYTTDGAPARRDVLLITFQESA